MRQRREQRINMLVTEGSIHVFPVASQRRHSRRQDKPGYSLPTGSYAAPIAGRGTSAAAVLPQAVLESVEPKPLAQGTYVFEGGVRHFGDDGLPPFYD